MICFDWLTGHDFGMGQMLWAPRTVLVGGLNEDFICELFKLMGHTIVGWNHCLLFRENTDNENVDRTGLQQTKVRHMTTLMDGVIVNYHEDILRNSTASELTE